MNLEGLTEGMFKAAIVAGSAYLMTHSSTIGAVGASLLAGYTIVDPALHGHLESRLDRMADECDEKEREKVNFHLAEAKMAMGRMKGSTQTMASVYGAFYAYGGLTQGDMNTAAAGMAILLGYAGLSSRTERYVRSLVSKSKSDS